MSTPSTTSSGTLLRRGSGSAAADRQASAAAAATARIMESPRLGSTEARARARRFLADFRAMYGRIPELRGGHAEARLEGAVERSDRAVAAVERNREHRQVLLGRLLQPRG